MQPETNYQTKHAWDVLSRAEETGLLYSLLLDDREQLIGIKRYAGAFCFRCNASLLIDGEESGRRAIKQQCDQCPVCGEENIGSSSDVIACASFDWIMAPHLLPRKSPLATRAELSADEKTGSSSKIGKTSSGRVAVAETDDRSRRRRKMAKPSNSVVDQFGNRLEVEQFWKRVVDPCPIQFYDRIRQ